MRGLKYIISYLVKEKFLLIVSIGFIILSTYYQVQFPKVMGDSITHLTNYAIVENFDDTKQTIVDEINKQYVAIGKVPITVEDYEKMVSEMSSEEVDQMLKQSNSDFTNDSMKAQTGYTFQELVVLDASEVEQVFNDDMYQLLIITLLMGFTIFVYNISMAYVAAKSSGLMKIDLFKKLHDLSIRFFDKHSDGDILSVFTNDIDNISNFITQSLVQVLSSIVLLIYITYTMFQENVLLAAIIVGLGVILIFVISIIILKARIYISKSQKKLGALNGYIDEQITGQKVNITNGIETEVYEGFTYYNKDYLENSIKGQIYSGLLVPINVGFMLLAIAVIIFVGSVLVVDNVIEIGLLVTFITFTNRFFQPFNQISSQYNMMQMGVVGADRVCEVMVEENESYVSSNPIDFNDTINTIEFKNVNFGYEDALVLNNINISVKNGDVYAIVGPTGSGKTTIMNLINRFYDVNSGEILFNGLNINEFTKDSLRRQIGIVLQDFVLFRGTIKENIAYGLDHIDDEDVINAAKLANIHDLIMSLENGYDSIIDNNSGLLSTGQKQLISIARTIITNPQILILDEATSNVDTVTEQKIQVAMDNVIKKSTSFVIAHRLKTIMNADKIIVLEDGKIVQFGSHDELIKEEGLYLDLYKNQFVFE